MKSQINILRQLQELVLTRDEHNQTGDGSHLDALNDAIDALQKKLEPAVAGLYERLYKKSHIVISAMSNSCCAVCGMQVPIAQGQQVRLAQHLVTCSSCGRILFADDDAVVNVSEAPDRDNPKTGISRFSAQELMVADLEATTREKAIEQLAQAMEDNGFISSADSLVAAGFGLVLVVDDGPRERPVDGDRRHRVSARARRRRRRPHARDGRLEGGHRLGRRDGQHRVPLGDSRRRLGVLPPPHGGAHADV